MAVVSGYAEEVTLSFANTAQRDSQTTDQQVWSYNGITFTNNKAFSTSNIINSSNPVRLYANSEIVVECTLGNITKIVFDCNSTAYATALQNSIGNSATAESDKVTVTLDGTSNSFTVAKLTAQVRMDALTVTYSAAATGETKPVSPTLTAGGNFVGSMEVEISCANDDADIYYTTDGTEPTEDSELYSEAFEITESTTVKAIAVNEAGASNVATAVYTRVAASPTISFSGETTFENSIEVTIDIVEGTTAYYTLDDKTPDQNCDECPETLTLKADATLQVIAYEGKYVSPIVKQKFTLKASGNSGSGGSSSTATLVEDAANLKVGDQVVIVATDYTAALSTEQKTNNRGQAGITKEGKNVTLSQNVQILTLEAGTVARTFAFYTGSGYLYAASSSSNYLKTQTTNNANGSWSISVADGVASIVAQGTNTRNVMQYNQSNGLFACYASASQKAISLYKVNLASIEDYILNVTAAGWATLYLGHAVTIPSGVTCYAISSIEDGELVLDELTDVIPASTGVLVKADEGKYTFKVTEVLDEVVNLLTGTTKNEYITEAGYVLSMVDGEVGLYKAKMNGGVFLNNANKAYLPVNALPAAVQGANGFKFRFETTGVEGVQVAQGKKVIFDLSGRKVNDMTAPGVYIVNGKKVLVK